MTDEINAVRNHKYHSVFDDPKYYNVAVFASLFILLALCGWALLLCMMMKNATVDTLDHLCLFLTSSGCLAMSVAYLVMRSKLKKLDQYQEEIIQCVYDSLELMQDHMNVHRQDIKDVDDNVQRILGQNTKLRSVSDSMLYLIFRNCLCPSDEQFKSLMGALERDISKMDLPDELYQKLKDNDVTTPLGIYRAEDWLLDTGICSTEEYYGLLQKIYELHPMLKELDRVPDLLLNVSDSADNYQQ